MRSAVTWLALLVFAGSWCLPLSASAHRLVGLDPDCAPAFLAGPAQSSLSEPSREAATPVGHCVFCHFLRAVSGAAPVALTSALPQFISLGSLAVRLVGLPRASASTATPSRAPPAFSF